MRRTYLHRGRKHLPTYTYLHTSRTYIEGGFSSSYIESRLRVFRFQKRAISIIAGACRRTSCNTFLNRCKSLHFHLRPHLRNAHVSQIQVIQTGTDTRLYSTRQRHQHRQTSHRLELASSVPQNIGPTLIINHPNKFN